MIFLFFFFFSPQDATECAADPFSCCFSSSLHAVPGFPGGPRWEVRLCGQGVRRQTVASLWRSGLQPQAGERVSRELLDLPPVTKHRGVKHLVLVTLHLTPAPGAAAGAGAEEGGRGGPLRHPVSASVARPGGRAPPGRWRCSRLRRSRLFSELRCEEPPCVRHIGARAAAAARCSSISCRRGRAEPSGGGDVGAAGREAGRGGRALPGGDGNEPGPASLRARPLRQPPWRGGPAAPERGAHAHTDRE